MNIRRGSRESEVTLPNWLWGLVITLGVTFVAAAVGALAWWFQHTMTTRDMANANTADIRHVRETHETFYREIKEKTTRMDEKLDRIMELIIHYGKPE